MMEKAKQELDEYITKNDLDAISEYSMESNGNEHERADRAQNDKDENQTAKGSTRSKPPPPRKLSSQDVYAIVNAHLKTLPDSEDKIDVKHALIKKYMPVISVQ